MRDRALIDSYLSMLDSPPPVGRQKEQVVQDFLESHTELIPTPNRLNHQVTPPDLSADGYTYIGGRLAATPDGPAGMFMYDAATALASVS